MFKVSSSVYEIPLIHLPICLKYIFFFSVYLNVWFRLEFCAFLLHEIPLFENRVRCNSPPPLKPPSTHFLYLADLVLNCMYALITALYLTIFPRSFIIYYVCFSFVLWAVSYLYFFYNRGQRPFLFKQPIWFIVTGRGRISYWDSCGCFACASEAALI